MTIIPFTEILFFIALFFAPDGIGISQIQVTEKENTIIFTRTEQGWKKHTDNSIWTVEGNTVKYGSSEYDLTEFTQKVGEHRWEEESILALDGTLTQILKTKKGLLVYPNGIDHPQDFYEIVYISDSDIRQELNPYTETQN